MMVLSFCHLLAYLVVSQAQQLKGSAEAVYGLLDRVLPGSANHFELILADKCPSQVKQGLCYEIRDMSNGRISIHATSASELSAGVGEYLRDFCNMTIGWPRGGHSNLFIPKVWPKVSTTILRTRSQPWSYFMNVCTHSYSLVWYSWKDWETFIDWMALSGINLVLALTGQEEVQYKVFRKFGLNDTQIRSWFNGPALLTWSRGQNEYGSDIAGPLPRSWMQDQWALQRQILSRYRSLGIVGQLPGFQGNVPVALKAILKDANMTDSKKGTAWVDSLDPLFEKIADEWMKTLIEDFGTDHWYQMDGYFNGGTAPWMEAGRVADVQSSATSSNDEYYNVVADPSWKKRGMAAYAGLNRSDPEAIWSFQGWAVVGWNSLEQASNLKGFIEATPPGKFVIIDMSRNGEGEWKQWRNASFWGAPFIWTTLHDFGGTDGMKGNLAQINEIPFGAMGNKSRASVWGTGFTPEGIDQNPLYYEFMIGGNWRSAPVANITAHTIARSHRRYGLQKYTEGVASAWALLVDSAYAQDLSVQDTTGVSHLPGSASQFEVDRYTPTTRLCKVFNAWQAMVAVAEDNKCISPDLPTFRYDLVNLGREVLAQLTTPASMNFSDAISAKTLDGPQIRSTGSAYMELLEDLDTLVATESCFLLGPWIELARQWGKHSSDCDGNVVGISRCEDFYEWNARVQLTTWNPTLSSDKSIPGGPIDYASKHWSGLIKDYYVPRARLIMGRALADADSSHALNREAVEQLKAAHAYNWTTSTNKYPIIVQGSAMQVSQEMLRKYTPRFASCLSHPFGVEELVI